MMTPAKYIEKNRLRKTGNFIGLGEILGMVVAYILIFAIELVAMLCGATMDDMMSFPFEMFVQMLYTFISSVLAFAFVGKLMQFRIGDLVPLKPTRPGITAVLVIIALGFSILGSYVSGILGGLLSLFDVTAKMPEFSQPTDPLGVVISLIVIAVVPALMEEFAFRGVILGSLRRFGDGFAIVISALLFGMFHGNFVQIPSAFIMGLALGYITVSSGSMWPAIIAHFINNALATLLPLWYEHIPEEMAGLIDTMISLLMMGAGLLAMVLLIIKRPQYLKLPKAQTEASLGAKLGWFFSAPMVIVMLATNILLIAATQLLY